MKKQLQLSYLLIVNFFIIGTSVVCYTQEYVPLVREGAYWCYNYFNGSHEFGADYEAVYSFIIMGDTLVNDVQYKNLGMIRRFERDLPLPTYYWNDIDVFEGYYGGIREQDRKVYFYKYPSYKFNSAFFFPDSTEVLLYNFNAEEGDTLIEDEYGICVALNIDSIQLNDGFYYRKIDLLGCSHGWNPPATWVEGAGDISNGLFGRYVYGGEGPPFAYFISFTFNDTLLYPNFQTDHCYLGNLYGVNIQNLESDVNIFVLGNELYVNLLGVYSELQIVVYNAIGELVNSEYISNQKSSVNLGNLNSGIYLAALKTNDNIFYTHKFLISK